MVTEMILLREWQASQVEFWRKTIFEGYDVSSFGRIRSYWRKANRGGQGKGFYAERTIDSRLMKPRLNKDGYWVISLKRYGAKRIYTSTHRLVALAFLPNPRRVPFVNHKTGIKSDARLDNLEWTRKKENRNHADRIGLRDGVMPKGSKSWNAKFTESDIREMRQRYANGESQGAIARDYGSTQGSMGYILRRDTWKHVE